MCLGLGRLVEVRPHNITERVQRPCRGLENVCHRFYNGVTPAAVLSHKRLCTLAAAFFALYWRERVPAQSIKKSSFSALAVTYEGDTITLQIFGVVLFSVFSVVNDFTETKKTPKRENTLRDHDSSHRHRIKFKLHRTVRHRSPPKFKNAPKICKITVWKNVVQLSCCFVLRRSIPQHWTDRIVQTPSLRSNAVVTPVTKDLSGQRS